jgi:hypothetical protein
MTIEPPENEVPVRSVTNPTLGLEELDSDEISPETDQRIDALLDAAETTEVEPAVVDPPVLSEPEPIIAPPGKEQVQPTAIPPVDTPVVELDPEISGIDQPRNLSPKNRENWDRMAKTADKYKKEADELRPLQQKVKELETLPPQLPPDYEELKKFRAIFDTEHDPEFISKYDQPIKATEESIFGVIKKHMSQESAEKVIGEIQKAGGISAVDQNWWGEVSKKLPFLDGEKLKTNLGKIEDLKEQKTAEIGDTAGKRESFLKERSEKQVEKYNQGLAKCQERVVEVTKNIPWANYKEANQGATEQEISEVELHNKTVDFYDSQYKASVAARLDPDPVKWADVCLAATASHKLAFDLGLAQKVISERDAKIEAQAAELSQIKNAGRAPKTSSLSSAKPSTNQTLNERMRMNASDAIDAGLAEAEGE